MNNQHHHKSSHPHIPAEGVFLHLMPELQHAVSDQGYSRPTPIQEQSIPHVLDGRDLIGCAQTGTGKTAAFTLPILQYLARNPKVAQRGRPRVLILAPTRELAAQIGDSIKDYGRYLKITYAVIFGGVGQAPQVHVLNRGVDILVATPGRLLDLMNQNHLRLDAVEVFVLDEADRMLDMGFIHDVKRIIAKLPAKRQTLFFSATMSPEVISLSRTIVHNPVHVAVTPDKPAVERIKQKVYFIDKGNKDTLLAQLLQAKHLSRVLVFVQMKHAADRVVARLHGVGVSAVAIHGNKSQSARTGALDKFKNGQIGVLVATDIAARGIDVDSITHVINYDLPNTPETYVHRIGRTARAGSEGDAVSFCAAHDREALRAIERMIRMQIPVDEAHRFHSRVAQFATGDAARPAPKGHSGHRGPRFGRNAYDSENTGHGKRPKSKPYWARRRTA